MAKPYPLSQSSIWQISLRQCFLVAPNYHHTKLIFSLLISQTGLISALVPKAQQMTLQGFLPTTLCRGVIRAHVELRQIGTFEGRSTD